MKNKEFEKKFIYRDDEQVNKSIENHKKVIESVNLMFPRVEKAIGRLMTDDEKLRLDKDRGNFVMSVLRERFPFPNADDEFNMQALGINVRDLLNDLNTLPSIWVDVKLDNGKLEITEATILNIKEAATQYTKNEKQNEALGIAEKIKGALNEALERGYIHKFGGTSAISNVTTLVHSPIGATDFQINRHEINRI